MSSQNGILLEYLLEMDVMKTSRVIAGFKGIANTVSSLNIAADPEVLEWVEPGQLLLTTAYYFQDNTKEEF